MSAVEAHASSNPDLEHEPHEGLGVPTDKEVALLLANIDELGKTPS